MVATLDYSSARANENPFMSRIGLDQAATAVAEFSAGGEVLVSLYDPRRTPQVRLAGQSYPLAANYSLPLAMGMSRPEGILVGLLGVLNPAAFFDSMGLYALEPLDPARIPVVFIHGLNSDPQTWAETYNEILAERDLRERYQAYVFYYPTGLPPMYPAAALKESLNNLHAWLKRRGVGPPANRIVLIGHSMGGLLTSTQIRDYRGAWEELAMSPIDVLPLAPTSREALGVLFNSAPPPYVKRAVFVATPHRGSNLANSWIGRLVSSIAKVPEQLLSFQLPAAARSLTDLGRSILLDADPIDAIQGLRYGNPVLRFNESRNVASWIPYHSIIGDRGRGDTPDSSDGVVPYSSSHLAGAQSELIIPSGHRAHVHPRGIAELKRILRLHLQN
jgi:pimeloyl-ACP methyl ester carboxylesterase